jgi:hypothetical protein
MRRNNEQGEVPMRRSRLHHSGWFLEMRCRKTAFDESIPVWLDCPARGGNPIPAWWEKPRPRHVGVGEL